MTSELNCFYPRLELKSLPNVYNRHIHAISCKTEQKQKSTMFIQS